jgi:acyl-CoA dehydrogenase
MPSSLETLSPEVQILKEKLEIFVKEKCQPAEIEFEQHLENRIGKDRWTADAIPPVIERLKEEAKKQNLWNLFLPHPLPKFLLGNNSTVLEPSKYLSNREYGILCEIMGRSFLAPEACNCSAPDTGNMEVLLKHGTIEQQKKYLPSLLNGTSRSAFLMTEPDVASSDATNIETKLTKVRQNDGTFKYILNGKKWWSTGAMDPRCKLTLVLARMDYSHPSISSTLNNNNNDDANSSNHGAHTVVVLPMSKVTMVRPLTVFGYDDAPHGHAEVAMKDIVLDESCLILGEGKGFEIAQSRLGPGRIHHCMRAVGLAARCYELMLERTLQRKTFGKYLWEHGGCQEMIADSRSDIEAARLLTLSCAAAIDEHGAIKARDKIAMIKVSVPNLAFKVIDRAMQVHGGAGVCGDFPLARALSGMRTLRIADGPDEVHKRTIALIEIKKAKKVMSQVKSKL